MLQLSSALSQHWPMRGTAARRVKAQQCRRRRFFWSTPACVDFDLKVSSRASSAHVSRASTVAGDTDSQGWDGPHLDEHVIGALQIHGCVESRYSLQRLLGKGLFGVVAARCNHSGERVAVKLSDDSRSPDASKSPSELLLQEAKFHMSVDHPHIVKLREVFQSASRVALVMDILEGGDAFSLVEKGRLPEWQAATLLFQALSALQHLHEGGLVHRDVKAENLVFADHKQTKLVLVDFGCAQRVEDIPHEVLAGSVRPGTLSYMAPEVYRHEVHDSKADMWSLGITAFVFLTQCTPWRPETEVEHNHNRRTAGTPYLWPSRFNSLSNGAKEFVRALLKASVSDRLNASEARLHPWLCVSAM